MPNIAADDTTIWSKLTPERKFLRKWVEIGPEGIELKQQVVFEADRKWKWDFAITAYKVAIEIDGACSYNPTTKHWRPGPHQMPQRQTEDNEKRNAGVEHGWLVLVYSSHQIQSMSNCEDAVHQVARVLYKIGEKHAEDKWRQRYKDE